jgi:hypothetical protein
VGGPTGPWLHVSGLWAPGNRCASCGFLKVFAGWSPTGSPGAYPLVDRPISYSLAS